MKSTKMDTCARLVRHYLSDDNVEDVTFVDGEAVFPESTTETTVPKAQMRRIIIYSEFSSMAPLLQNVSTSRLNRCSADIHQQTRCSNSTASRR